MPSAESGGALLLDTHCWLWMEAGRGEEFSREALAAIQDAAKNGALLVSVISIWEIGMLEAKRRLRLLVSVEEWVERALETPGLSLAPLTKEIALESTRLPGEFHGDPADRILIATARRMEARLATRDPQLIRYGEQRYVRVLEV